MTLGQAFEYIESEEAENPYGIFSGYWFIRKDGSRFTFDIWKGDYKIVQEIMRHVQLGMLLDHVSKMKSLDVASLEHVESCRDCRSDLRWLEQLENLRKFEPPKLTVETVMRTFINRNNAA